MSTEYADSFLVTCYDNQPSIRYSSASSSLSTVLEHLLSDLDDSSSSHHEPWSLLRRIDDFASTLKQMENTAGSSFVSGSRLNYRLNDRLNAQQTSHSGMRLLLQLETLSKLV